MLSLIKVGNKSEMIVFFSWKVSCKLVSSETWENAISEISEITFVGSYSFQKQSLRLSVRVIVSVFDLCHECYPHSIIFQ